MEAVAIQQEEHVSISAAGEYYPAQFREDLKRLIGELRKLL